MEMEAEAGENEINDDKSWIRQALASAGCAGEACCFSSCCGRACGTSQGIRQSSPAHVDVLFMAIHTLFFRTVSHSSQIVVTQR